MKKYYVCVGDEVLTQPPEFDHCQFYDAADVDARIADLEQFKAWAEPQCEDYARHKLRIAELEMQKDNLLSAVKASQPHQEAVPTAWMRGHTSYIPGEPAEYDVECFYGDEPPDTSGKWTPLYKRPSGNSE